MHVSKYPMGQRLKFRRRNQTPSWFMLISQVSVLGPTECKSTHNSDVISCVAALNCYDDTAKNLIEISLY